MNYQFFTPKFKDEVLQKLCSYTAYRLHRITYSDLADDAELLRLCLYRFEELDLIRNLQIKLPNVSFVVTSQAVELLNSGGFQFQAETLNRELTKAKLELDKLQADSRLKDYVEHIGRVTRIISDLISAAKAFI